MDEGSLESQSTFHSISLKIKWSGYDWKDMKIKIKLSYKS